MVQEDPRLLPDYFGEDSERRIEIEVQDDGE